MTWLISPQEHQKYNSIFEGMQPINGLLSGEKVKPILLNSKLPVDVLGRVWELSDIDVDGFLDKDEFAVAMHLVYRALEKVPIPLTLPMELLPPSKMRVLPGSVQVLPQIASFHAPLTATLTAPLAAVNQGIVPAMLPANFDQSLNASPIQQIIITMQEKQQYDEMFRNADSDLDGYVNGAEIKDVFLQSGLQQLVLAHIWRLCDVNNIGKLNSDQYALAMHFIKQKLKEIEPPPHLLPEMIPPILQNVMIEKSSMSLQVSKEIDTLAHEIAAIKQEKLILEQDKAQKEADVCIKSVEVANLQKELDGLVSTIKQLEMQKGEAQKRLDELDDRIVKLENNLLECKEKYKDDQKQIEQLRYQITHKDVISSNEEAEIERMQLEIQSMLREEQQLEQKLSDSMQNKRLLNLKLSELQKSVAQTNISIDSFRKVQDELQQSVKQYDALLNGEITEEQLNPAPITLPLDSIYKNSFLADFKADFSNIPLITENQFLSDLAIKQEDPFGTADPFAVALSTDPFESDPFKDTFEIPSLKPASKNPSPSFFTDSIGMASTKSIDPWGSAILPAKADLDLFDPFSSSTIDTKNTAANSDPFGTGSFFPAFGESSSPVLPPKQKKNSVPPRPPALRPIDPFSPTEILPQKMITKKSHGMPKFKSEAEQLAWVKRQSEAEFAEQKRLRDQEQADFELALAISQQDK